MDIKLISYLNLDPRKKENDEAREGFVHWFYLTAEDLSGYDELVAWLKENTQGQYEIRHGSSAYRDVHIYLWMKSTNEAMMLKLSL